MYVTPDSILCVFLGYSDFDKFEIVYLKAVVFRLRAYMFICRVKTCTGWKIYNDPMGVTVGRENGIGVSKLDEANCSYVPP
jgi:hypothetical protein